MRRKEKEISNKEEIVKILKDSKICRIAIHDNDYPYIVPMNYGYNDNKLYFHCAKEGRKIDLLKKNNKVGFEIEQSHEIIEDDISCKWTTKFSSIIGFGSIKIIDDFDAKVRGLDILMTHHGKSDNSYNEKAVNHVLVLELSIENITAKQSGY